MDKLGLFILAAISIMLVAVGLISFAITNPFIIIIISIIAIIGIAEQLTSSKKNKK